MLTKNETEKHENQCHCQRSTETERHDDQYQCQISTETEKMCRLMALSDNKLRI